MCEKDRARAEMEQEQSKCGHARERKQKQTDTVCQSHCFLTVFWTQSAFFATLCQSQRPASSFPIGDLPIIVAAKLAFLHQRRWLHHNMYLCVWRLARHLLTSWNSQVTALRSSPAIPRPHHLAPHLHMVTMNIYPDILLREAYSACCILCTRHTLRAACSSYSARGVLCVQHTLHAAYSARGILCARHSLHAAISACSILCACVFLVARNKEEMKSNLVSWRVNLKLQRTP